MADRFTIDVVSDVISPWCFLGKRRLDAALAALDPGRVHSVASLHARPHHPAAGPRPPRIHAEQVRRGEAQDHFIHNPLIEAGQELDVPYYFNLITRTPNTLDAHRLIRWAHTVERQTEMVERLFMAGLWSEGKDVGDRNVLAQCAGEAGINAAQIRELLDTDQDVEETKAEIAHATNIGVTGVPTFIMAQSYALVGAQSPAVLVDAITRVAKELQESA